MVKTLSKIIAACGFVALSGASFAQSFSSGIPAGWTGVGGFGTLAADGVVALAPGGGSQYGYVTTVGGVQGVSPFSVGYEANGSTLRSNVFASNAGDALQFNFNYVTSDGATDADYAWARLLNEDLSPAALLFTARTTDAGVVVPGVALPALGATIGAYTFSSGVGNSTNSTWSALGSSSGTCFGDGCGFTGWVSSSFAVATAGNYILEFGVVNWNDDLYQSGLAFDGLTIGGNPVTAVPEPESIALMLVGVGIMGAVVRRRKSKTALTA